MAAKELTVVILNHTNEELQLQPESLQLELGELLDLSKPSPPKNVLAGESVIWSFRSAHIGGGIQGQVAYQMVGFEENASVTFHWSVHLVGTNKFTHTSSVDGFTTRVLGGSGRQPVAVFVLGTCSPTESALNNGTESLIR